MKIVVAYYIKSHINLRRSLQACPNNPVMATTILPAFTRRYDSGNQNSKETLRTRLPEQHSALVRKRGGLIVVPGGKLKPFANGGGCRELTKLLLNVTIQRSLGPVQVVISPENTVRDLIKSASEIYVKEKRRPLLTVTDPRCFELHYSQFSLECLKPEEKLINLGSRNFFLCSSKTSNSITSSCNVDAEIATKSPFPWIMFMDFLL